MNSKLKAENQELRLELAMEYLKNEQYEEDAEVLLNRLNSALMELEDAKFWLRQYRNTPRNYLFRMFSLGMGMGLIIASLVLGSVYFFMGGC